MQKKIMAISSKADDIQMNPTNGCAGFLGAKSGVSHLNYAGKLVNMLMDFA